ncbi:MAG: DUF3124 domain-containing protein [Ferruginibacter sp.]
MLKAISIVVMIVVICLCIGISARKENKQNSDINYTTAAVDKMDFSHKVYVPVHSNTYAQKKYSPQHLKAVLTIRNTSLKDSLYVSKVEYYDKQGNILKQQLDSAIVIKPMSTFEIIAKQQDHKGNLDNFIVQWHTEKTIINPVIQAVMYDASNRILFSNDGVDIR